MNLKTLLVHRRNRSLRPNAAAAWAQFAAQADPLPVSPPSPCNIPRKEPHDGN
jgi:hypothetical protein